MDATIEPTRDQTYPPAPFVKAKRFVTTIERGEEDRSLHLERIAVERFARAKVLRLRFRDKPLISFTDLTTMVVMQELRVMRVLTADEHFRHVGLGFEVVPRL